MFFCNLIILTLLHGTLLGLPVFVLGERQSSAEREILLFPLERRLLEHGNVYKKESQRKCNARALYRGIKNKISLFSRQANADGVYYFKGKSNGRVSSVDLLGLR